jgi:hypothetical protein
MIRKMISFIRTRVGWLASPKPAFIRLKALAGSLPSVPAASTNAALLAQLLGQENVTWEELDAARIALVAAMPVEQLVVQFETLQGEYKTITGELPSFEKPTSMAPEHLKQWQAIVLGLIENVARLRQTRLQFERVRSIVGMLFGGILFALILAGFVYVELAYNNRAIAPPSLWQPLLFLGFGGAGFSVLSRLYSLSWSPQLARHTEDVQALKKGLVINCILSLAAGVIAAGAIYLLFASGLLRGSLFPEFPDVHPKDRSLFFDFLDYEPKTVTDVAKLFTWAFIAGFAERLIPDKLKQLAGEANRTE